MRMIALLIYLAVAFLCVYAAERLARRQHRSRKGWMWAAALLGPLPLLILVFMPEKTGAHHA
jgi:uncharacterized membrane protein HdeD (DUF308 family)